MNIKSYIETLRIGPLYFGPGISFFPTLVYYMLHLKEHLCLDKKKVTEFHDSVGVFFY